MAINTFPAVASPVKSVQRGSAGGAGTVTITSVDITKSFVNIQGTTSTGTVSASFSMNNGTSSVVGVANPYNANFGEMCIPSGASRGAIAPNDGNRYTWSIGATTTPGSVNGGSTNLVAAQVQGYLSNSTSLVVSAACRWEVVEYN